MSNLDIVQPQARLFFTVSSRIRGFRIVWASGGLHGRTEGCYCKIFLRHLVELRTTISLLGKSTISGKSRYRNDQDTLLVAITMLFIDTSSHTSENHAFHFTYILVQHRNFVQFQWRTCLWRHFDSCQRYLL